MFVVLHYMVSGFWNLQNSVNSCDPPKYKTAQCSFKTINSISVVDVFITWSSSIVDEDVESFLLLKYPLSKFPDRIQRRHIHQTQVDIRVSCFLLDFFKCCCPPGLASTGQDDTGPTACKVQGYELPDPWQSGKGANISLIKKKCPYKCIDWHSDMLALYI